MIKGVKDSYDALVELLESIEHLLYRLDIYTRITPTVAMTELLVKILVELLSTLALATKEVREGKPSEPIFPVVLYHLTQCDREICQETVRREEYRGRSPKIKPTHRGRGEIDRCTYP